MAIITLRLLAIEARLPSLASDLPSVSSMHKLERPRRVNPVGPLSANGERRRLIVRESADQLHARRIHAFPVFEVDVLERMIGESIHRGGVFALDRVEKAGDCAE